MNHLPIRPLSTPILSGLSVAAVTCVALALSPTAQAQNINVTSGTTVITGISHPETITAFKSSGAETELEGVDITISGEVATSNTATLRLLDSSASRNSTAILASQKGTLDLTNVTINAGASLANNYVSGIRVDTGSILTADTLNITVIGTATLSEQRAGIDILGKSQANVKTATVNATGNYVHGAFNSAGSTTTIEDSHFSSNGFEAAGIYTYGGNGGSTVTANNVTISTAGANGYGLYAAAASGGANGTGKVFGENISIDTSGGNAWGVYARWGGEIEVTNGSINTTGASGYGVRVAPLTGLGLGRTSVSLTNVDITTNGASAHAFLLDQGGVISVVGGTVKTVQSSAHGLQLAAGAVATFTDTVIDAAGTGIRATLGNPDYDIPTADSLATINLNGETTLTARSGKLLEVVRSGTVAHAASVVLNIGSGASATGNIFDNGTKTTGYLDINVASGGTLTSNIIEGFRNINVGGSLLGNGTLTLSEATSLLGDGVVGHNVTVNGGTLSSSLVIRGQLTLDTQSEVGGIGEDQTYEVQEGTQANISTVESGATVDASAGTANIQTLEEGSTLIVGNWGATVTNLNGATIQAGNGTVRAENVTGGEIASGALNVNNEGALPEPGTPLGVLNLGENTTLSGNGVILADTAIQGGNLNPGNSPGTLTFAGDLSLDNDTTTTFELNGVQNDFINVVGALEVGGTLSITLGNSYMPTANETITLFAFGTSTGEFAQIIFNRDGYQGIFDTGTGSLTFTAVPEPSTYVFVLGSAATAWWLSRRRKATAA